MSSSNAFRSKYTTGLHKAALNWFPKHMNSGLKQMQAKLRSIDCVLEVHDARVPLSGRNPTLFQQMVGPKPHILILNKADLIQSAHKVQIMNAIREESSPYLTVDSVVFTNSKNDKCPGVRDLVPKMCDMIEQSERFHRATAREYHAMIIGIPNVGKSSLINILRSKYLKKGRAVKVGPSAGVTKCVHEKVKICERPQVYLFDTPGILQPRIPNVITGMKLAACGNFPDEQVGNVHIADFILFKLNKAELFKYTKIIGLPEPSDCIATVLSTYARKLNLINKIHSTETNAYVTKPDFEITSTHFIKAYREGKFGRFPLDNFGSLIEVRKTIEEHVETYDLQNNPYQDGGDSLEIFNFNTNANNANINENENDTEAVVKSSV